MDFLDELAEWGRTQGADVMVGPGAVRCEWRVAQRRKSGMMRHLRYRLDLEVDSADRTVILSETLWERHPGTVELAADLRPRDEAYRMGSAWERTVWSTHGKALAQMYKLHFDFDNLRHRLERLCERHGHRLRQLIPL